MERNIRRPLWVALYAIAMAAVESAVVVYLRALHGGGDCGPQRVGAVSLLRARVRSVGHLLLCLVVGLHRLAALAVHLGRALSHSRPVARTGARARDREPLSGGRIAVAARPLGPATVSPGVGARRCWRRARAAVFHDRLPLCARAHGSTAVPVGDLRSGDR